MALLENRGPTAGDLRWFGLLLAGFAAVLGAIAAGAFDAWGVAWGIWAVGALLGLVYYGVRPLRPVLYAAWMRVFFPLGWLISHALIAVIYYLLLTPIAVLIRLTGRDPLALRRSAPGGSGWVPLESTASAKRYFQQF